MSLPQSMRAVVHQSDDKNVKVESVPLPSLEPGEILVRVHTVGLNPTDYKHAEYFSKKGDRMGCDFAGEIAKHGPEVPSSALPVGERVFGFVRGGLQSRTAAFAEYVALPWDNVATVPSNVSYEQAASLPIPAWTAVTDLYHQLKLPEPPAKVENQWFLVWSGASAVGLYAIQFAKASGYQVIATASESNWKMLKSLGADVVLDYNDKDIVTKIKESTKDTLGLAMDCYSMGGSLEKICQSMGEKGGQVIPVLFPSKSPREDVKLVLSLLYSYLYTTGTVSFGDYSPKFKCTPEDHAWFTRWEKKLPRLLEDGTIKPIDVKSHGSLEDMAEGFKFMSEGKNRGYKMIFNV